MFDHHCEGEQTGWSAKDVLAERRVCLYQESYLKIRFVERNGVSKGLRVGRLRSRL